MEELGRGFWLKLVGGVIALGVALFVLFLIFNRLVWGFGFLGALLIVAGILLVVAWFHDKRHAKSYGDE
jgi:uncharacterized membrane protein HdeD (DUF308 family)